MFVHFVKFRKEVETSVLFHFLDQIESSIHVKEINHTIKRINVSNHYGIQRTFFLQLFKL